MNILTVGHENGTLNLFDFNQNKIVKTIGDAHQDSVSSLAFSNSGLHLISGSHDGSIKVWDIRNYKCVSEIVTAH
jgi:WD40 repeat protein